MKVVQINSTCDVGSTGKICVSLSRLLTQREIENHILYTHGHSSHPLGIRYSGTGYRKLQALKSRILGNGGFNAHLVTERMNDKEYVKKLEAQNEEQRAIMREIDVFRKEYEAASAEDPEGKGEKMKALLKKRDELHQKLEINRLKSTAIIRERMRESAEKK